ncbi:MAG: cyclic nucleotide-binding domain-containing protein [Candidatus Omnitrophica bacterium]|nr:cyclic nucleotide-binding domain-containing protein [Candidatus Omnitrophota bacterium]
MVETLEPILKKHPFFKDLQQEYLDFIVGCASNVVFKEKDLILKENDPADKFYLIREGMVAIQITNKITIQTLQSGDILGWSWLIPPYKYRFNCKAVEKVRAIALDGKCLREKCEKNHDLGYELLKRLTVVFTQRLEATRKQIVSLTT